MEHRETDVTLLSLPIGFLPTVDSNTQQVVESWHRPCSCLMPAHYRHLAMHRDGPAEYSTSSIGWPRFRNLKSAPSVTSASLASGAQNHHFRQPKQQSRHEVHTSHPTNIRLLITIQNTLKLTTDQLYLKWVATKLISPQTPLSSTTPTFMPSPSQHCHRIEPQLSRTTAMTMSKFSSATTILPMRYKTVPTSTQHDKDRVPSPENPWTVHCCFRRSTLTVGKHRATVEEPPSKSPNLGS